MNIAIVLTHNKTDTENATQISFLVPLIEKQIEVHNEFDDEGNIIGQFNTYYYTIKGLIGHDVKFYQIIPYGVTPPTNLYDIDSHKVFYGKGDEDKVGTHLRFYNWGLKRATDYGADVVVHLADETKLDIAQLSTDLQTTSKVDKNYGTISPKGTEQVKE